MSHDKNATQLVAFQGIHGAHSDMACRKLFPYLDTLPCPSFEDVFMAVESGKVTYGVVPIENSRAGRVAEIHNLLPETQLHIIGEYLHPVQHHLLAPKGANIADIQHVYSHPQALMQCRNHLIEMGVTRHAYADTAGAAEQVAEWNDPSRAALATALAAELYGLQIVRENMQDSNDNSTLFVTIARELLVLESGTSQQPLLTSVLFTTRNIPASLYKALGGFATNGINLLKLESYLPVTDPETASFFISFVGSPEQPAVQLALEELGFFCRQVKLLGVYPADKRRGLFFTQK